jgi:predicted transcriptional regulator
MFSKELQEILKRVETWPKAAQEQAVASLQALEHELLAPYELTEDDKRAINRGLEAARRGDFATEEEVEAVFAKFRRK